MTITQTGGRYVARSTYDEREILKSAGFRWDPANKVWWTSSPDIAAKLSTPDQSAAIAATVAAKAEAASAALVASRASDTTAAIPCPEGLAYLPYQRAGIAFAAQRSGVLFGDEMGLGKTIQAIGVINADESIKRVLVLCPASLRINWARELSKWLTRPLTIGIAIGDSCPTDFFDIVVCNYDIAERHAQKLRATKWDLVVADEAHYLKNPKTKRTQAVFGSSSQSDAGFVPPIPTKRRVALTGTPIPNRPIEVFPILHWLDSSSFPNFFAFAKRYCNARQVNAGRRMVWDFTGSSNLPELQTKMRSTVMVRRLKADVLTDLPPKRRVLVEVPQNGAAKAVAAETEAWSRQEAEIERLTIDVQLAKASDSVADYESAVNRLRAAMQAAFTEMSQKRHDTAVAKIPYVVERVIAAAAAEHKVVVFAHHTDVIEGILAGVRAEGLTAVRITGADSMTARQAAVDRFQNDPNVTVFVGNLQAAGVGITLTAASHVIFAELDWVPGNVTQGEDRCILHGQKILTTTGWRPVETVAVGDMVIGRDGLPHRVIDTWNRLARQPLAEISVRGWREPLVVTTNHRMLTTTGWVEAGHLTPGSCLCMPAAYDGFATPSLQFPDECRWPDTFGPHGQRNGRLAHAPESILLTPAALFTFGYYLGDGFSSTAAGKGRFVSLSGNRGKKQPHLAACMEWAASVGTPMSLYSQRPGQGVEARMFSAEWAAWFAGEFGRTVMDKHIPEWAFGLSVTQRQALLQGMMASDGYARRNRHDYITVSERLAADTARLMMSLGLKACVTIGSTGQFVVQYSSGVAPTLSVTSITIRHAKHSERVYDLTVDDAESFVVGTAVAHNCHRLGQHSSVLVEHVVIDGSLDAKMAKTLIAKQAVADAALDTVHAAPAARQRSLAEPICPGEPSAVHHEDRDAIGELADTLTAEDIRAIHDALIVLAERCDGARQLDGAGFNRFDAHIGKALAYSASLTPRQAALGYRVARKYRKQLGDILPDLGR